MEIGSVLRESRISAKMSVEQVSNILTRCGYKASQKTVYSWENGNSRPDIEILMKLCDMYGIKDILRTFGYNGYKEDGSIQLNLKEIEHIEKYRALDSHGQETVSYILDREAKRVESHGKISNHRILNLIEISPVVNNIQTLPYWQEGAAAGTGIYQLNDTECIPLKLIDSPITRQADFIINVSGKSMEPDYHDGDKVLVSQKAVVQMGEVGIFIKNGKSYIKELGTMELISRNPESDNISVNEFDNVVCMGKVIGKVTDDMIISD